MLKIGIVIGSTRPGRRADAIAQWVMEFAKARNDAAYEIIDLADYDLANLDEPIPPSMGKYTHEHTKVWSAKIDSLDAFVFVTPEYNHSISGALKNAIDFVYREWNNKVAGFVSYGTTGGARAVEHLRGIMAEVQVADVRAHVSLSLYTDFENFTVFKPAPNHQAQVNTMLDQVNAWGRALKAMREEQRAKAA